MRPYVEELSQIAPVYHQLPPQRRLAQRIRRVRRDRRSRWPLCCGEFVANGWLNIVGGCCGTTPDHIRAFAEMVRDQPPRQRPAVEPLDATERPGAADAAPREQLHDDRRADQRHRLAEVCPSDPRRAIRGGVRVARQQVEGGANIIDINMDDALLDGEAAMTRFLNLIAAEPDISRVPVMIDSSQVVGDRGGLEVRAGQGDRQLDQPQGRRRGVSSPSRPGPPLRCRGGGDGLRRRGPGDRDRRQGERSAAGPTSC